MKLRAWCRWKACERIALLRLRRRTCNIVLSGARRCI